MSYNYDNGYGGGGGLKREAPDAKEEATSREDRKRKRKSRWGGSENDKVVIPGMPTVLPPGLTPEQEKIYLREYHDHDV